MSLVTSKFLCKEKSQSPQYTKLAPFSEAVFISTAVKAPTAPPQLILTFIETDVLNSPTLYDAVVGKPKLSPLTVFIRGTEADFNNKFNPYNLYSNGGELYPPNVAIAK